MSEQTEATAPAPEESAFGSSFDAALTAAFGEVGAKVEPANPTPDIPNEVVEPTTPETIDDVAPPEVDDIVLPIDEEVVPAEPDEPTDVTGMTKAAGERFKELRAEVKDFKTKLSTEAQARAAAEARVKELEAATGQSEEVTKKLAEYELELSIARLEATSQYREAITQPLSEIASTAETIATKYGIDASKLLDAIAISDTAEQDEAFDDLLSGVNERDKLKIYAAAEKLPSIVAERERLHENRDAAIAELDARKTAEAEAAALENAKARKAAAELVAARVAAKLPFLKGESFNLEAAKSAVVETDFDTQDTTTKAYNAMSGKLVPQMAKHIMTIMQELETVTDELSRYKKSAPSPKGGSAAAPIADDASFVERLERQFASVGA